jgi:hypothetical protein
VYLTCGVNSVHYVNNSPNMVRTIRSVGLDKQNRDRFRRSSDKVGKL